MTNGARLGIAMMGLGCARRALVEALCYARAREAFGKPLAEQPLMQRKLAELIVDVEAAQALVFDGYDPAHRLRIGAPLIKLQGRSARHHGGQRRDRGARRQRLLRELAGRAHPARRAGQHALGGPRQHLLPRRAPRIERENAHVQFLAHVDELLDRGVADATTTLVRRRRDDLRARDRTLVDPRT